MSSLAGFDPLLSGNFLEKTEIRIVDDFMLLPFLHCLHGEAYLLAQLVDFVAVEIGDACVGVEHGGDGAELDLAGILRVIDKGGRQLIFTTPYSQEFGKQSSPLALFLNHLVNPIGATIDIHIGQQMQQPAWRDVVPLGDGDGCCGEVACCDRSETEDVFCAHDFIRILQVYGLEKIDQLSMRGMTLDVVQRMFQEPMRLREGA